MGCADANGTASYDELRRAQSEAESCARDPDCWASWCECLTSDVVLGLLVCSKGLRVKCQRRRRLREGRCKSNRATADDNLGAAWSKTDACSRECDRCTSWR